MHTHQPVIRGYAATLAHVPDLVRYGSKPRREIALDAEVEAQIQRALRSFDQAVSYAPNEVFVGRRTPDSLSSIPRPWYECDNRAIPTDPADLFGEIMPQDQFYALLKAADVLSPPLIELEPEWEQRCDDLLRAHPRFGPDDPLCAPHDRPPHIMPTQNDARSALPLMFEGEVIGRAHSDARAEGRDDTNLAAHILLENLCAKATGALAVRHLLQSTGLLAEDVGFIISCGEEACGDRYQRGGGGMAKAIGEMCHLRNASGMDIKNFCAAPASSIVTAGAMVASGLFDHVVVVGGGSLAKLGMKFQGFLAHEAPILDDCLASIAFLVSKDDGVHPILRLEPGAVGLASIGASASDEAVYRRLVLAPLKSLKLGLKDVDRFAPELHNPEIMQHAGSGDVATKNYRAIAALAVMNGDIQKSEMNAMIARVGMAGFAPTQGHIPSAVAYLGHALRGIQSGTLNRVMFVAKASLFLGRCTDLYDGVSFIIEANPG